MSAVVHHGGAGTTNASLRSGSPTIVTPIFFDQFDHAYLVSKLGVGVGFSKHFKDISKSDLAESITVYFKFDESVNDTFFIIAL